MPDSSTSASSTSGSDSSGSFSSEDEGQDPAVAVAGVPNPTFGVATDVSSTEDEYVPNPGLICLEGKAPTGTVSVLAQEPRDVDSHRSFM